MKTLILAALSLPLITLAQSVDVKGVTGDDDSTTTIQIRKTKNVDDKTLLTAPAVWEVVEGQSDIEGEPAALVKEARASWKAACESWKKDFRADNKENKIINMNCGTPNCSGDVGNKICASKATYKIKTKVN